VTVSKVASAQAAVAALGEKLVAQATVQDADSAMPITPAPHTSLAPLVMVGTAQPGVHVIDGNTPAVQVAVATFGMYPAAQTTVHEASSAMPMVAPEQIPLAWALATVGT
jgi:hypothetical protein